MSYSESVGGIFAHNCTKNPVNNSDVGGKFPIEVLRHTKMKTCQKTSMRWILVYPV